MDERPKNISTTRPNSTLLVESEGMAVRTAKARNDFGEFVREIRRDLSGRDKPITQERLSELLGVSWSTIARWEGGQSPDPSMRRKLSRLREVIEILGDMVHPDDRVLFLEERHPLLLKMRPIDLLETDEGFEAVKRVLEGAASGAFQ